MRTNDPIDTTLETIRFRNTVSVLPPASTIPPRPDQQRGSLKTKRDETSPSDRLSKPDWIRVKAAIPKGRFGETKDIVRAHQLVTVCEEASCPNIAECWSKGTATFMIMGDKCTRRCRFCNVSTGRPDPLDQDEPERLAQTIALMKLNYVVITSVDRDDLRDGGAAHFVQCIQRIRALAPTTTIEILTPDFGGRLDLALDILGAAPPDVLNHNIETVPRLYKEARPGADFQNTLNLLKRFKDRHPAIPTKSGLMVGLGETDDEILEVLRALRAHCVDMLTIGQYLQPSGGHMPVLRYVHPDVFKTYADAAYQMGFKHAASGPLVRSSYHADEQARAVGIV
jgi:lipoic acid synthetase